MKLSFPLKQGCLLWIPYKTIELPYRPLMKSLNRFWIIIKLFHLHAAYILASVDQEYFYLAKASYFTDLKWYKPAIRNFQKSLKRSDDPGIIAALGWCYFHLGMSKEALENYRRAYVKSKQPDIAIGLAYAEYNCGNIDESRRIVSSLSHSIFALSANHRDEITKLKNLLEAA